MMKNFFIEFQDFGWNGQTVFALATMLCTIFQGYGVFMQNKKIWREREVKSLSVFLFFFYLFFFMSLIFYALEKKSFAMLFNSLLFILYAPIVIGLIKFKKITFLESLSFVLFASAVVFMAFTKHKDFLFSSFLTVSLMTLSTQPLAMIKERSRGAVEIRYVVIFLITSIFWFGYGTAIGNRIFQVFNLLAIIIYIIIIFLYRKYRE